MKPVRYQPVDLLAIALGGVIGASLRWLIGEVLGRPDTAITVGSNIVGFEPVGTPPAGVIEAAFPYATLTANVVGCLLLGALTLMLRSQSQIPKRALVAAATGFCGSLTTFSAFAVDVALRLRTWTFATDPGALAYEAAPGQAALYVGLSVVLGALAFALGRSAAARMSEAAP